MSQKQKKCSRKKFAGVRGGTTTMVGSIPSNANPVQVITILQSVMENSREIEDIERKRKEAEDKDKDKPKREGEYTPEEYMKKGHEPETKELDSGVRCTRLQFPTAALCKKTVDFRNASDQIPVWYEKLIRDKAFADTFDEKEDPTEQEKTKRQEYIDFKREKEEELWKDVSTALKGVYEKWLPIFGDTSKSYLSGEGFLRASQVLMVMGTPSLVFLDSRITDMMAAATGMLMGAVRSESRYTQMMGFHVHDKECTRLDTGVCITAENSIKRMVNRFAEEGMMAALEAMLTGEIAKDAEKDKE